MKCNRFHNCQNDAKFNVYATYGNGKPYPAPQASVCSDHLGPWLDRDLDGFGSSCEWLVRLI